MARVRVLSNGNLLANAHLGPDGAGAVLNVPNVGNFSDGTLSPGEFVDVPFVICLQQSGSFSFLVDLLGLEGRNPTDTLVRR
jgi:hypothetical protein